MSKIQLFNDDCLSAMQLLPENSIDLVVCDLPYGTTSQGWDVIIPMKDYVEVNDKKIEFPDFLMDCYKKEIPLNKAIELFQSKKKQGLWSLYERVLKPDGAICLFGQEPFSTYLRQSNIDDYRYDIYWEKERLTNIQQVKRRVGKTVETISVFYKKQPTYNPQMISYDGPVRRNTVKNGTLGTLVDDGTKTVIPYKDEGKRYPTQVWKYHREFLHEEHFKTQKPIELLKNLICTFSNEGDTILDNTMGWGSTGRACVSTNRDFIGIELNPEHFKKAKESIEKEVEDAKL